MKRMVSRCLAVVVVLFATLSLGCPSSVYNGESTLNDDGTIERVVYQPAAQTPESASKPDLWKKITFAPDPEALKKQNFGGAYSDLPAAEYGKDRPYFVGVGKFDSPRAIPIYFEKKAPPKSGLDDSKLVRNYERIDHVFVVEHRWSETLTDVVTQDGMRKARDELADLAIDVFADTFAKAYGQDYAAAALIKWLKAEGKAWWVEITDYIYLFCLNQKSANAEKILGEGLEAICARHGLNVPKALQDASSEIQKAALIDFTLRVLRDKVKNKKDGSPVEARVARKWIEEVLNGQDGQGKPNHWQQSLEEVVATNYGGQNALTEKTGTLLMRIFGLHYPESFIHARNFDYTMTFPGDVVETNGELLGKNKVLWKFPAKLAYPQGYTMSARSLTVKKELQKDLLGAEPLNDLKARERFVFLMKWSPEALREAMRECRIQKSLAPLEVYKKKASPEELEWFKDLENTLKPPADNPPGQ